VTGPAVKLFALAVAVAGYGLILVRRGFSALATPSAIGEFAATTARKMAVPSAYRQLPSTENIRAGMQHFADRCATCHSNDGGGHTLFGKGLYPKPPAMRAAGTQNNSDGELYCTIENGVRLSGMPAFGTRDDVLDDFILYWLTNTAISAARFYWELHLDLYNAANVSVPAAVSVFPGENYQAPRSWTERAYHELIYYNQVDRGGHHAAWEQPQLFSEELRAGFRSLR